MAAAHMQAMLDNTIYSEKASIIPLSLSTYRLLSTAQALLNVLLAKILKTTDIPVPILEIRRSLIAPCQGSAHL